jgi:hypothetical protein
MSITVFGLTFGKQPELAETKVVEIDFSEDLIKDEE